MIVLYHFLFLYFLHRKAHCDKATPMVPFYLSIGLKIISITSLPLLPAYPPIRPPLLYLPLSPHPFFMSSCQHQPTTRDMSAYIKVQVSRTVVQGIRSVMIVKVFIYATLPHGIMLLERNIGNEKNSHCSRVSYLYVYLKIYTCINVCNNYLFV